MKNIFNLLRLQFNSLISQKKSMGILIFLSVFYGLIQPTMVVFVGAMFLMVACYSVIFCEEKSKMNYLIYSLPITIKEYILSKYIYGLINTIIAMIITVILSVIIKLVGFNEGFALMPLYAVPLVILILGIFFSAVVMPATLLLGFEKGRLVLLIIAVLPMTFSTGLVQLLPKINFAFSPILLVLLGILISIAILLTSYFITCNAFSKKEVQ